MIQKSYCHSYEVIMARNKTFNLLNMLFRNITPQALFYACSILIVIAKKTLNDGME